MSLRKVPLGPATEEHPLPVDPHACGLDYSLQDDDPESPPQYCAKPGHMHIMWDTTKEGIPNVSVACVEHALFALANYLIEDSHLIGPHCNTSPALWHRRELEEHDSFCFIPPPEKRNDVPTV